MAFHSGGSWRDAVSPTKCVLTYSILSELMTICRLYSICRAQSGNRRIKERRYSKLSLCTYICLCLSLFVSHVLESTEPVYRGKEVSAWQPAIRITCARSHVRPSIQSDYKWLRLTWNMTKYDSTWLVCHMHSQNMATTTQTFLCNPEKDSRNREKFYDSCLFQVYNLSHMRYY